jgi:2-hydroxy-3-keto-5-methylthiopentenyl-1-phosphate phosphatase
MNRNMFDPNYLYKHINNTDVAFQVMSIGFTGYSQLISVRWFNIVNPDEIKFIDTQHSITVLDEDSHNWIKYAVLNEDKQWKVVYREATLP